MKLYRVALLLSLLSNEASAFSTISSTRRQPLTHHVTSSTGSCRPSSSLLMAEKKRRRRKDSSIVAPSPSEELPDFDDAEDEDFIADEQPLAASSVNSAASAAAPPTSTKRPTQIKRGSGLNSQLAEELGGNVDGLDEELILESMRGKAGGDKWQPPQSIQDTLSDRSLEKLMNFDKMIEQDGGGERIDLPEFDDVIARRKARLGEEGGAEQSTASSTSTEINTAGMGKKAARDAQRRAAAIQREAEIEAEKSPFEGLNILKLLENGAWVGIGLLVLWEFYINSPFFDRALPLIPVVYDDVPPGM
ncbi:hypothetical protein ACHAWT_001913 [Skeletonema menzelii]